MPMLLIALKQCCVLKARRNRYRLGLDNIIAVYMPDAVLISHKDRSQGLQKYQYLKINNIPQAEVFSKDHRPWGWFESLAFGDTFQVKRICVNLEALLVFSHRYRSEHWVVVEGSASTVDNDIKLLEGQSVYIPLGSIHG